MLKGKFVDSVLSIAYKKGIKMVSQNYYASFR
jgi:hypothetical protein